MFTINFKTFLNKKKNYFKAYKPCVYQQNKMRPLKILKMIIVGLGTKFQDKHAQKKRLFVKKPNLINSKLLRPTLSEKNYFCNGFPFLIIKRINHYRSL